MIGLAFTLFATLAHAQTISNVPEVGPHLKILTFEKNLNPQNILIVYTRADHACHLLTDPDNPHQPVIGFYWLMEHSHYKPVHSLIQNAVRERLVVEPFKDQGPHTSFTLHLNDLKELDSDLPELKAEVSLRSVHGDCEVKTLVKDPALQLLTIYSEARTTWLPPFRKVVSITLKGLPPTGGPVVEKTFSAKP
jgi:hypothetical protein